MRIACLAAALTLAAISPALAQPPPPAPAAAPAKFGPDSTFKQIMANPRGKAILDENIPLVMQVLSAGLFEDSATLKQVAASPEAQSGGGLTPEVYANILAELAKL